MPTKQFRSSGPMTLNNFTNDELEHLRTVTTADHGKIKYICWNQEIAPTTGTPHLQIYSQATDKLSVKSWHKYLGERISNIVPTANIPATIQYCKGMQNGQPKPGSDLQTVEEYGHAPKPGERNDLIEAGNEVRKRKLDDIMLTGSEHEPAIAKHYTYFRDLDALARDNEAYTAGKEEHAEILSTRQRQPWERHLQAILENNTDKRSIHWYYDCIGETGKTVNAKALMYFKNAFYSTGGKAADIAHAYKYQPIVVFNIAASQDSKLMDHLYKVLEEFKDGVFSSGKYNSRTKAFKIPQVIVFANERPNEEKLKTNRFKIYDIGELNSQPMLPHLVPAQRAV